MGAPGQGFPEDTKMIKKIWIVFHLRLQ